MRKLLVATLGLMFVAACNAEPAPAQPDEAPGQTETAIFAGGCFWCVEADFDKVPGVVETVSGYSGGTVKSPTYKEVSAGGTGHQEVVKVVYDPARVSYAELLTAFWHSVDPTDAGGQFCDRGESYTTAIYATSDEQLKAAEASRTAAAEALEMEIATVVEPASAFYPAEEYHQNYYRKNPIRYRYYRGACDRDDRVEELWGDAAFKGIPGK